jgi:GDPmannose 4,6-dehydratase
LLLGKGYEVHGIVRRSSTTARARIEHLRHLSEDRESPLRLHYGDMLDTGSLVKVVEETRPDEVYNLASQSHVRISFDMPELTYEVTGMGAFRMLESVRRAAPEARFYQAGSSEMFGSAGGDSQDESSPMRPRSPYGIAKVFAHYAAVHYRDAYGLFVANGIMFNHESPRRGENFVTRKVARAAARIHRGIETEVRLGALETKRDWGYAPEYVEAMWLMLQQERPGDFVIATGETHSVQEWVAAAFEAVGLDWRRYVVHDNQYDRPTDVPYLRGNAEKAGRELGWTARTKFADLVRLMVQAELDQAGT